MRRVLLLTVFCLAVVKGQEEETVDDDLDRPCYKEGKCKLPRCACMTQKNPFRYINGAVNITENLPQFVMLTFDDAVNVANIDFYNKTLFNGKRKNPNGKEITGTFFVTHEYNNYANINYLYSKGHEIATHSITHSANTERWRNLTQEGWKDEISGMRDMIDKYAGVPKSEVKGMRAPFLQTAGNVTFDMLQSERYLYDSSLATRSYSWRPIWPYTMDYGMEMDCVIEPCPTKKYPGLWLVPLVSLWKMREVYPGKDAELMPCAMADACIPAPSTAKETEDYFMENFQRHYTKNRAPFPLFLHEAYLKDPARRDGYLRFVDNLLHNYDDVYFVTVQEVIEFMQSPKSAADYKNVKGRTRQRARACANDQPGKMCPYAKPGEGFYGERIMYTCYSCPSTYPWFKNIS